MKSHLRESEKTSYKLGEDISHLQNHQRISIKNILKINILIRKKRINPIFKTRQKTWTGIFQKKEYIWQ